MTWALKLFFSRGASLTLSQTTCVKNVLNWRCRNTSHEYNAWFNYIYIYINASHQEFRVHLEINQDYNIYIIWTTCALNHTSSGKLELFHFLWILNSNSQTHTSQLLRKQCGIVYTDPTKLSLSGRTHVMCFPYLGTLKCGAWMLPT